MWLSKQRPADRQIPMDLERITLSESQCLAAGEDRQLSLICPGGIAYRPREGEQAVLIRGESGSLCLGILSQPGELEPGELRLSAGSRGGIRLLPSGEIFLNGLRITEDGRILTEEGKPWTPN